MEEEYLKLSDIHGNVSAFDTVLNHVEKDVFSGVILLGDCIDYGMRSNEIIQKIIDLGKTNGSQFDPLNAVRYVGIRKQRNEAG